MKFLFALSLLAASMLPATALPTDVITVSGTVITEAGPPLEYATVSAFAPDSTLIDGTVTDEAGRWSLDLPRGAYRLRFEFLGFQPVELARTLVQSETVEAIILRPGGVDLDAVEVSAGRSQLSLSLDKKVFNVGEDALSANGTANEVLEQIPSVTVGPDGAVAYRGDGGIKILINGRPSALADRGGLASIPASSIERIEIITNPSAIYEAAGTAGILNVILKKEVSRGYGGTVNVGTGVPAQHTVDVSLNLRREKFTAYGNFGGRYSNYLGTRQLRRTSSLGESPSVFTQTTEMDRNDIAANALLGIDYNLNATTTLSGSYSMFHVRNDDLTEVDYSLSFPNLAPASAQKSLQITDYLEPGTYHQTDLTYGKTFGTEGRKLNVYFKNDRWREPEYEDVTLDAATPEESFAYRTVSDESSNDYLLQADYTTPLGEYGRLETGLRAETRIINSDYSAELRDGDTYTFIPELTNDLDYFERIGAAYTQYGYEREKFSLQAGLRAEYTAVRTENERVVTREVDDNYLNLFPSLSLQYQLNEAISSQVSYSRRIRRPPFGFINTFGGVGDPTVLFRGNPDIDPIYLDRVEWNLLYRTEKLTLNPAVYAGQVNDFWKVVVDQTEDNFFGLEQGTIILQPVNLGREQVFGAELTANYLLSKAVTVAGELNYFGFREEGRLGDRDFAAEGSTWSGSLSARLSLPADVRLQSQAFYTAARTDAQGTNLANYAVNFGASKEWNDKFTVSLAVRSPRFRNATIERPTFSERDDFQWTGWRGTVSLRYRFEKGASSEERRARGSIR